MSLSTLKLRLTGVRGLLMHADRYSNPLDPMTKRHKVLTAKRKKTDEDHEAIAKSEWAGSLYYDNELGPYIPGVNIDSCIIGGAKKSKLGTTLKSSCEVLEEKCRLNYTGTRDIEELWAQRYCDVRSVVVNRSRIMRYRPFFPNWELDCTIMFSAKTVDAAQIVKSAEDAGLYVGLGDFRPRFGKFTVSVIEG